MSNYRNYGETWEVAKSTAQLHTCSTSVVAPKLMVYFIMHYELCIMSYAL